MPYTWEDYERDVAREILPKLSREQRLEGLTPEERLEGLPVEVIESYLRQRKAMPDKSAPKRRLDDRASHAKAV